MTNRQTRKLKQKRRAGFTLIELLVVISIIAVLASLILPAVQAAREAARRTQCINNQKNIALAMTNFDGGKGGLPYIDEAGINWPAALLGYLDRNDLVGRYAYYNTVALETLGCPNDTSSFKIPEGINFVVNAGYGNFPLNGSGLAYEGNYNSGTGVKHNSYDVDWNSSGGLDSQDVAIARDLGVFGRTPPVGDTFRQSLTGISSKDGTTNTFMLTENLNARNWGWSELRSDSLGYANQGLNTFQSVLDVAFVVNSTPTSGELMFCTTVQTDGVTGPPTGICGFNSTPILGTSRLNSNQGTMKGNSPFPSSYHSGGIVIFAFCDGHVKPLSETMNGTVYVQLMTPGGTRLRGQRPVGDNEY